MRRLLIVAVLLAGCADLSRPPEAVSVEEKPVAVFPPERLPAQSRAGEPRRFRLGSPSLTKEQMRVQLMETDRVLEELRKKDAKRRADESAPERIACGPAAGKVTAVDENVAAVNIGSANGLKKGSILYIYRDSLFIAKLRIEDVRATEAVGIVIGELSPYPGDDLVSPPKKSETRPADE